MSEEKAILALVEESLPYAAIGAAGGAIRALNANPFSWKRFIVRASTGGFTGGMLMLYLSTQEYSAAASGVLCGIAGVMGTELLETVQDYAKRKLKGLTPK